MINNAKVEITLGDLDNLRNERARLALDNVDLRKQLDELRVAQATGTEDGPRLAAALGHALEIVRFAIGNLDPLTVRGWPAERLLALAELLPVVPGVPTEVAELWCDWRIFGRRAAEWEEARKAGTEQAKLADENLAKHPGAHFGDAPID